MVSGSTTFTRRIPDSGFPGFPRFPGFPWDSHGIRNPGNPPFPPCKIVYFCEIVWRIPLQKIYSVLSTCMYVGKFRNREKILTIKEKIIGSHNIPTYNADGLLWIILVFLKGIQPVNIFLDIQYRSIIRLLRCSSCSPSMNVNFLFVGTLINRKKSTFPSFPKIVFIYIKTLSQSEYDMDNYFLCKNIFHIHNIDLFRSIIQFK